MHGAVSTKGIESRNEKESCTRPFAGLGCEFRFFAWSHKPRIDATSASMIAS